MDEPTGRCDSDPMTNVLVETPAFGPRGWGTCLDLFSPIRVDRTNVLCVTLRTPPWVGLEYWEERSADERPRNVVFVTPTGADFDGAVSVDRRVPDWVTITTVSNAGDLTELGTRIFDVLDEWEGRDEQPVLCLRELTIMLQYAGVDLTRRFLHTIADRIDQMGGLAHYHIDPGAHDATTMETLMDVVDERVSASDTEACRDDSE